MHLTSDRKPDADSLSLAESLRKEEARCRREGRTVLKKGLESGALLEMRKEQGETRKHVTGQGGKLRSESSRIIAVGKEPLASLTFDLLTLSFFAHAWTNERNLLKYIGGICITFLD